MVTEQNTPDEAPNLNELYSNTVQENQRVAERTRMREDPFSDFEDERPIKKLDSKVNNLSDEQSQLQSQINELSNQENQLQQQTNKLPDQVNELSNQENQLQQQINQIPGKTNQLPNQQNPPMNSVKNSSIDKINDEQAERKNLLNEQLKKEQNQYENKFKFEKKEQKKEDKKKETWRQRAIKSAKAASKTAYLGYKHRRVIDELFASIFYGILAFVLKILTIILIGGGIITVLFIALLFTYSVHAEKCDEFRTPQAQGWAALAADYGNRDFRSCIWTNVKISVGIQLERFDVTNVIMNLLNEQVYRATGDMLYNVVDENQQTPTGVFIEDINLRERYYNDEPITFAATLNVRTIGDRINGTVIADINGLQPDEINPPGGIFSIDESRGERILVTFNPNRFQRGGVFDLKIATYYDFISYAYMVPTFIKASTWYGLTQQQQNEVRNQDVAILRGANTPMQIGGQVNTGDRINIIEDSQVVSPGTIEFTIHADAQSRRSQWTNGRVNTVHEFVMILPEPIRLRGDSEQTFRGCGGYSITKHNSCNEINLGENYAERLGCQETDNIYSINTEQNRNTFSEINTFLSFQCPIDLDVEKLFSADNEQIGVMQHAIKVASSYKYEVSRIQKINILNRPRTDDTTQTPITHVCSNIQQEKAQESEPLSEEQKTAYARYSHLMNVVLNRETMPQLQRNEFMAMGFAISEAYNNFEDGRQLVGCGISETTTAENDIRCMVTQLNQFQTTLPEVRLQQYYEALANQYPEERRAGEENIHQWLRAVCDIQDISKDADTEPAPEPDPTETIIT
ncbi:MAG: hypothetical protein ACMXYE_00225 [Candidatus Woesearchaeota archaeon]